MRSGGLIAKGAMKMMTMAKVKVAAVVVGVIAAAVGVAIAAQPATVPGPPGASANSRGAAIGSADALLAKWEQTYGQLDLMRCRESSTEHVLSTTATGNSAISRPGWVYCERICDGKRFRYRTSDATTGFDDIDSTREWAFDGTTTTGYVGSDGAGVIEKRETENGPIPGLIGKMIRPERAILRQGQTPPKPTDRFTLISQFRDPMTGGARKEVRLRPNLELVSGEPCHVLEVTYPAAREGSTNIATVTLWLALEKDCLLMKYESIGGDRIRDTMEVRQISNVKTQAANFWYPASAVLTHKWGSSQTTSEITCRLFDPSPNYQQTDFIVKFPRGMRVYDKVRGEVFVADETGRNPKARTDTEGRK